MLKTLSFCSGAGGLDIGLQRTCNTEIVLRCENDPVICETILCHQPDGILYRDIMQLSAAQLCQHVSETDVVMCVGGIPCPSFSTAGKRKALNDPRGACLTKFLHLAIEIKATYIVLENVRGLLSASLKHRPLKDRTSPLEKDEMPGTVMASIVSLLESYNYSVSYQLVDAKFVGAATARDRVILMAHLGGECLGLVQPTHDGTSIPFRTLGDVIRPLENSKEHIHIQFPSKRLPYFAKLQSGQNWRSLPKDDQLKAMGPGTFAATGGKSGVFRRLSYNKPCPTLMCSPIMHTTALCHPVKLRPLSVQEYAAIQGFDPSYEIKGSVSKQYRQLGNAVPTALGEAIGRVIQAHRDGLKSDRTESRMSRYKNPPYCTPQKK